MQLQLRQSSHLIPGEPTLEHAGSSLMPRLLLMRHAKSSWSDPRMSDHDRPLNKRGQAAAPRMGRWLQENDLLPERIFSSTARRACDTATLIADSYESPPRIELFRDLYHATPDEMIDVLASHGGAAEVLMLVAHNPGIEDFISEITTQVEFCPTAVVAVIDFQVPWVELLVEAKGSLESLWRPREILADQPS